MAESAYHKKLRLKQFTVFADAEFAFSPGVNALVGENGTGKTHLMKALFAWQLAASRGGAAASGALFASVFQVRSVAQLRRRSSPMSSVEGVFGEHRWNASFYDTPVAVNWAPKTDTPSIPRPVFIPAIDMMGHTLGFVTTYDEYHIDFDLTHRDIVSLLLGPDQRSVENGMLPELAGLGIALGGSLERDGDRFYIRNADGMLPMPVVAEGVRKVATLFRLAQAGWLGPGTALFWDEPEVNLNPMLMDNVVAAVLALSRSGVQVFLATHSYTILREIEVQATCSDHFRFFALAPGEHGVVARQAARYLEIEPNPIEVHATGLYDRSINKRLGDLEAMREPGLD